MTTYYKAVQPDGTDFYTGAVQWAVPNGTVVRHPSRTLGRKPHSHLSVATVPTDCTGMRWPCRLLTVEAVGGYDVITPDPDLRPSKRASLAWRVTGEVDAHLALGPQGEYVAALIERASKLTADEARQSDAAWGAARFAGWDAGWNAAGDAFLCATRSAARDAALAAMRGAVRGAASGALSALVVRDLIEVEHYDTLTRPWRSSIGPIHPDDDIQVGES